MSRRKRSNNPDGRPSSGLGEAQVLVRLTLELDAAVRAAAAREGLGLTEWWRRAAQQRLDTPAESR